MCLVSKIDLVTSHLFYSTYSTSNSPVIGRLWARQWSEIWGEQPRLAGIATVSQQVTPSRNNAQLEDSTEPTLTMYSCIVNRPRPLGNDNLHLGGEGLVPGCGSSQPFPHEIGYEYDPSTVQPISLDELTVIQLI